MLAIRCRHHDENQWSLLADFLRGEAGFNSPNWNGRGASARANCCAVQAAGGSNRMGQTPASILYPQHASEHSHSPFLFIQAFRGSIFWKSMATGTRVPRTEILFLATKPLRADSPILLGKHGVSRGGPTLASFLYRAPAQPSCPCRATRNCRPGHFAKQQVQLGIKFLRFSDTTVRVNVGLQVVCEVADGAQLQMFGPCHQTG